MQQILAVEILKVFFLCLSVSASSMYINLLYR